MLRIDLNCDLGEGFGVYAGADDAALLEHVTSANIACGFHGGDPATMALTVKAAAARGVAIGAHPGLPDLQGFGRRAMQITEDEAYGITLYQIGALRAFAGAAGRPLRHVKAHGALYNMAARDAGLARALCRAVRDVDPSLLVYALSGSSMVNAAEELGLAVACEAFADRSYQDDGSLTPRSRPGAMIPDLGQSIAQVRRMLFEGKVRSLSGKDLSLRADTVCIHGDQPGAVEFARGLRAALEDEGVAVRAPAS
jgi:UPF0271 protein